ncbi:hypothetical protein R5R49_08755 [Oenococcus oeni]
MMKKNKVKRIFSDAVTGISVGSIIFFYVVVSLALLSKSKTASTVGVIETVIAILLIWNMIVSLNVKYDDQIKDFDYYWMNTLLFVTPSIILLQILHFSFLSWVNPLFNSFIFYLFSFGIVKSMLQHIFKVYKLKRAVTENSIKKYECS